MAHKRKIEGFLHYRTDLGDGVRTGVVFSSCAENCAALCCPYSFQPEHAFAGDTTESGIYTAAELAAYLVEEKTLCYSHPLGITFLGREPLWEPFFCQDVAIDLKNARIPLTIYTCGMCNPMAFDLLADLTELFVLRLITADLVLPYHAKEALAALSILEQKGLPYRLLIPVLDGVNTRSAEDLATLAASLSHLKSVILDFSNSTLTPTEIAAYRHAFLSKSIPLY